jgi:hypothetical protein
MPANQYNHHRRIDGYTKKDYEDYGWLFGGNRR